VDETFIKMCKEAVEIQEEWEPKPADKIVLFKLEGNPYGIKGNCHCDYLDMDAKEWEPKQLNEERIYWLPRQEDLQATYKQIKELSFDCCYKQFKKWDAFMYRFVEFEHTFSAFNMFETGSWNVLWLCFVMEKCYNKTWNGSTWEAIQ